MNFLPLIWSNLNRKKLRSLLTVLSILVAFILFGLLCAIKEALTGGVSMEGQDRLSVLEAGGYREVGKCAFPGGHSDRSCREHE